MKQIQLSSRTLPILAATILATSCIYDKPPGDEFHRTLWKSDEVPLGPFDACTLTLEFLCDDVISITTTGKKIICFSPSVEENRKSIYGTYACDGVTATFLYGSFISVRGRYMHRFWNVAVTPSHA